MAPARSGQPHPPQPSHSLPTFRAVSRARSPIPGVLLFFVVLALAGGTAAGLRAQGTQPVFRSGTELVRLDVSVTDKDGRPVSDLAPEEVQISENGRPMPIVLFRHLAAGPAEDRQQNRAFEEVSANAVASFGHLYVLLFDQAHIVGGREQRARQAAERFLLNQVRPGDAVAVYGLPGPGPVLNFTTDMVKARARLAEIRGQADRRAVGGLREYDAYKSVRSGGRSIGAGQPTLAAAAETAPDEPMLRTFASQAVASADAHTHVFLKHLTDVIRGLRSVDGRKAVVLFSEGFLSDNTGPQLEQVMSAAAESHSLVYPVDLASGDAAGSDMSAAERAERREPLARLASETNGSLFAAAAADLDRILASIGAQANDYYLVGFQPSAGATHDYHRVKVAVSRPGVVVRARSGYSTMPVASPITDRQAIDVALSVPRTSSALPIEYTTYERGGPTADKPRIIASVSARVPRCSTDARTVEVVFIVRDAVTGQAAASGTDQVRVAAARGDAPGALDPVKYSVQFDVPPGEYWMRVLVREPGGVIGTADRRFHVWPLTGTGVTTSDLIVTRLDGNRFDPPAQASVSQRDSVLAYLEIYGAGEADRAVDARVDIISAESDEVVATAEPIVKSGPRGEMILRARVPVDTLAAGFYAARVRVTAPNQGPRTVVRNFRVVAAAASTNH